jgi:hypothetical protein
VRGPCAACAPGPDRLGHVQASCAPAAPQPPCLSVPRRRRPPPIYYHPSINDTVKMHSTHACAAGLRLWRVARRSAPGWPDTCPPSRTGGTASCTSRAQQTHTACAHGAKLLNHALLRRAAPAGLARAAARLPTHPLAVSREPQLAAPGVDAHTTSAAARAHQTIP